MDNDESKLKKEDLEEIRFQVAKALAMAGVPIRYVYGIDYATQVWNRINGEKTKSETHG